MVSVIETDLPITGQATPRLTSLFVSDGFAQVIEETSNSKLRHDLNNIVADGLARAWIAVRGRCRLLGCSLKARTPNRITSSGRKAHRWPLVFCADHAGMRNQISKADLGRLKRDETLSVVVVS